MCEERETSFICCRQRPGHNHLHLVRWCAIAHKEMATSSRIRALCLDQCGRGTGSRQSNFLASLCDVCHHSSWKYILKVFFLNTFHSSTKPTYVHLHWKEARLKAGSWAQVSQSDNKCSPNTKTPILKAKCCCTNLNRIDLRFRFNLAFSLVKAQLHLCSCVPFVLGSQHGIFL